MQSVHGVFKKRIRSNLIAVLEWVSENPDKREQIPWILMYICVDRCPSSVIRTRKAVLKAFALLRSPSDIAVPRV